MEMLPTDTHRHHGKLTPHSYHPVSITRTHQMQTTLVWACMWVNICETAPHNIWANCSLFYSEASHRSSRSSISLSGCAAPRLRSGRWGQPCPPLYWSVGGSSSAPPPWTKWRASGCLSAQPPPHRRAPPEYWPTEGRRRMRMHKDRRGNEVSAS